MSHRRWRSRLPELTVAAVVQAGAAGVNPEDRRDGASFYTAAQQAKRLAAARAAVGDVPVWSNARTDIFLSQACPSTRARMNSDGRQVWQGSLDLALAGRGRRACPGADGVRER
jgi:Phosphoenolpyruvate phosphomutase